MNIEEAFEHIRTLSPEELYGTTVCSIYYDEKLDCFCMVTLFGSVNYRALLLATQPDFDEEPPEIKDEEEYRYTAYWNIFDCEECEEDIVYYLGKSVKKLCKTYKKSNYMGDKYLLENLTYHVVYNPDDVFSEGILFDKVIEYVLFAIFPELCELLDDYDEEGLDIWSMNLCFSALENHIKDISKFKNKAIQLVQENFPLL